MSNLESQDVGVQEMLSVSSPPVSVIWLLKPGTIAAITLLSYLTGGILASMNWYQIGLRQKAHVHLLGGAWMMFVLSLLEFDQPTSRLVSLLVLIFVLSVTVAMARYLFIQMRRDIAEYRTDEQQVLGSHGWIGVLVGLSIGLLYVLCFTFIPVLMIGAVLFLLTIFVLLVPAGESVF